MKDLLQNEVNLQDEKSLQILKNAMKYELRGDCLFQWLDNNQHNLGDSQKNQNLENLL